MSKVITIPDIYDTSTYVSVNIDFSDVKDKIEMHKDCFIPIIESFRTHYLKKYTLEAFVTHWYYIFKNYDNITTVT